ncbi:Rho GTPase activation protein, partial [Fimicolochytrium jonesii]|uniref:Rho GTPase activation protein n=1 Tax=Fimicolochytrium jonesii TaxID=1396493 RepID=UPI0022FEF11D
RFDKANSIDLSEVQLADIPAVASLLKQWIRELPDGLIPETFYKPLENAAGRSFNGRSVEELRTVLSTLPQINYHSLRYLCRYLRLVASHADRNRMTTSNLSVVFAPNVFKCPSEPKPGSTDLSGQSSFVAESMIVSKIMASILDDMEAILGAVGDRYVGRVWGNDSASTGGQMSCVADGSSDWPH